MAIPPIPYGWSDFGSMRREGALYVDKTRYLDVLERHRYAFLIRPRRFGKSCWVSLLENYYDRNAADRFEGLFSGTDIGAQPTPNRHRHVVLRFDFSAFDDTLATLRERFETYCHTRLRGALERNADLFSEHVLRRVLAPAAIDGKLNELFEHAAGAGIRLYVLIDEYDNFANTVLAHHGTDAYESFTHGGGFYRSFFATLKAGTASGSIERLFITGVSPITMDDVTSGFNIAANISLDQRFNELLGFTEAEVRDILATYREAGALTRDVDDMLIDEYDKPMLDALGAPDVARANRDYLRGLYATIKDCDADVRFAFLTGVSKFAKVSVFSGLNNLQDITLDEDFADICGYTDGDLDAVFAPELGRLDRDEVRLWYNGYNWLGDGRVYNPFDILLLFQTGKFRAHWFETGTPAFLVETLAARNVGAFALDGTLAEESLLSAFDVDRLEPEALLFQTGYLTIRDVERRGRRVRYRLGYPNLEVRQSLNESLLDHFVGASERRRHRDRLCDLMEANDFDGMAALFTAFLAGIPYNWRVRNDIADYEGNEVRQDFAYASVFYSYFASQPDMQVAVEDAASHGRVDMAVLFNGHAYVFEFKVVAGAAQGRAMTQLRARDYALKYRRPGRPVHLVAVEFSKETRNVVAFEVDSDVAA